MRAETNSALYYRDGRYDMESINRSVRDAREGKTVWKLLGRRRCYTVYDARSDLRTSIDRSGSGGTVRTRLPARERACVTFLIPAQ